MASAPEAKAAAGSLRLNPYYVGTSEHKGLTGKVSKHTHYVLIPSGAAKRMGITKNTIVKPGTDSQVDGVILQLEHKGKGSKKHIAKRFLHRYASGKRNNTIEAYLDNRVKLKSGGTAFESYSISFPSSINLSMIIAFFKKNCPKVVRINTGSNFYGVR